MPTAPWLRAISLGITAAALCAAPALAHRPPVDCRPRFEVGGVTLRSLRTSARTEARACDGRCTFDVSVCVQGDECSVAARRTMAAGGLPTPSPTECGPCGPPTTVTIAEPRSTRTRRFRATLVAHLYLRCRANRANIGCPTSTTTLPTPLTIGGGRRPEGGGP